jgi:thymidylate synthase
MFDMGSIYGRQWRNWNCKSDDEFGNKGIDQISELVKQLKDNPNSRRMVVSAWAVHDLPKMTLPPCHYGFQVYTRELSLEERRSLVSQEVFNKIYNGGEPDTLSHSEINQFNVPTRSISLMFNMRSVDTFLGFPFNIASYGLLLEILAKEVNMVPDQLIGNLGDTHLYLNHIEQAKEQIGREPFQLPTLNQFPTYEGSRPSIESYVVGDFTLKDYQSHETIKAPLSN